MRLGLHDTFSRFQLAVTSLETGHFGSNVSLRIGNQAEAKILRDFVCYAAERIFGPEIYQEILDRVSLLAWISDGFG